MRTLRLSVIVAFIGLLPFACVPTEKGALSAGISGGFDVADAGDSGADTAADGALDDTSDADGDALTNSERFPAELAAELDALLTAAPRSVDTPGLTLFVSSPVLGNYASAAGLASTRNERAMVADDRLRIGSVTKTFTSAVILQLSDEGMLSLDDPVDTWVPAFDLGPAITIETLLNHTSGVFNFTDDAAFVPMGAEPATAEEVIAFAEEHGRVHEVGAAYSYTNTGYFLLGLVVEAATSQTFAQVVRDRLLEPYGLADTFVQPDEEAEFADGHTLGTEATSLVHMSWAWAAGGMIATGGDLCRWAHLLFEGRVLGPDLTDAMIAPTLLLDGRSVGYGYGVDHSLRGGVAVIGHTGSTMGFRGELFYEPDRRVCVAVLANDFFAEPGPFSNEVWSAVLGFVE